MGTFIPQGHYLTKTEIAELRGVIPETVQKWIEHGDLHAIKIPYLGYIVSVNEYNDFQPNKKGRPRGKQKPQK